MAQIWHENGTKMPQIRHEYGTKMTWKWHENGATLAIKKWRLGRCVAKISISVESVSQREKARGHHRNFYGGHS
jgi:hypothetical protein